MIRAYKYRIYPTDEQKAYFAKAFGCVRYAFNFYVCEHERAWKEEKKTLGAYDMSNLLRVENKKLPWLKEADSESLKWTALNVEKGYKSFWEKINSRPPHERKKGDRPYQSYTTCGALKVYFKQNLIRIPIVGNIRARLHRRFYGQIKHVTITQSASGYYASFCVYVREKSVPMKPFSMDNAVGIDVGVHHFLTLSDGTHIEMPDVSRLQHRKAFLQRRLKHQQPKSKGYEKTKQQIARLSERISNIRRDFHHKTAAKICKKYSVICMETINVAGMRQHVGKDKDAKNRGFNRKLVNVGLSQFSKFIEQKAKDTGTHFCRVDRWEPTTKRCHVCGYVNKDITLSTREWTCPNCGTHHDRDVNAAINIKNHSVEQTQHLVIEEPLDDEIIAKQLPQVVGKVKPAKKGLTSCQGTGKMAGGCSSRPDSQIDEGTTPARLAFSFDPVYALRVNRLAKDLDVPWILVGEWLAGNKGRDIAKWNRFIDKLMELADNCRKTLISSDVRLESSNILHDMNEYVHMERLTKDALHYDKPFYWWRVLRKTDEEISVINQIYSEKIPEMIDKFVEEYVFQK